jgi:hypothetical protein
MIDSFTEGLIEKDQFTTRMARTKTRIADLDSKLERDAAMSISRNTFDMQQLGFVSLQQRLGLASANWQQNEKSSGRSCSESTSNTEVIGLSSA